MESYTLYVYHARSKGGGAEVECMKRFLVTAVLSIFLYNIFLFFYLLFADREILDDFFIDKKMKDLNMTIGYQLSRNRQVNISELFPDAVEACLTGIDIDPLYELRKEGVEDVDYYFGIFGELDWNDTAVYITIRREGSRATIIRPNFFHIGGQHTGGCADGKIVLKVDDSGKLYFPEKQ